MYHLANKRIISVLCGSLTLLFLAMCSVVSPVFAASSSSRQPAHARGGGAFSFVQIATAANTHGDYTLIDNSLLNGDKDAVIIVTPVLDLSNILQAFSFDTTRVGVEYLSKYGRWAIVNEDQSAMPVGARFNVEGSIAQTSTSYTLFVNTGSFVNPTQVGIDGFSSGAQILVTHQIYEPAAKYDTHTLGVSFNKGLNQWVLLHEDSTAIQSGQFYNIVLWPASNQYTHVVSVNTLGLLACANTSALNGNASASPVVTINGNGVTAPVALLYDPLNQEWCAFATTLTPLPASTQFLVSSL